MANRRTYFQGQFVEPVDLNAAGDGFEQADRNLALDTGTFGITGGAGVGQHSTGDLSVVIAQGVGYDQSGQRCAVPSPQTLDVSVDSTSTTTAVAGAGNSKIVSVFLQFLRVNSTPETDTSVPPQTIQTVNTEGFKFVVVQGAEAVSPTPPALLSNGILLADLTRTFGSSTILTANIGVTRRQDAFRVNGSPRGLAVGTAFAAVSALLGYYDAHVTGGADRHPATAVDYAGGTTWADGTTNPAATVEAQIDKVLTDLASTSGSGADKVGIKARTTWLGGRTNGAGTVFAAVDKIITDLSAATLTDDGAERVGAAANTGSGGSLTAGSLRSQLDQLDTTKAPLNSPTFPHGLTVASGDVHNINSPTQQINSFFRLLGDSAVFIDRAPKLITNDATAFTMAANWIGGTAFTANRTKEMPELNTDGSAIQDGQSVVITRNAIGNAFDLIIIRHGSANSIVTLSGTRYCWARIDRVGGVWRLGEGAEAVSGGFFSPGTDA